MDPGLECYSGGIIFKTVLITAAVLAVLEIAAYFFYTKYWKKRRGQRLVPNDKEAQKDDYAFDNPGFHGEQNATPTKEHKNKSLLETKWLPIGTLLKQDKRRTVDDSGPVDYPVRVVPLKGRDFTGLGFDIRGGLRDGIYVDYLRQSGPAHQSGKIQPGDKLRSIRIDFDHMALQDALSILGAAAPYDVLLEVQQQHPLQRQASGESPGNLRAGRSSGGRPEHPLYRAYSSGDVNKVGTLKKNGSENSYDDTSAPKSMTNSKSTMERNGNAVYAVENEKKQTHASSVSTKPEVSKRQNVEDDKTQKDLENDNKKGFKFGVRVLPPNVNDKLFSTNKSAKTETDSGKVQDNGPAPVVKRRNKEYKEPPATINNNTVPVQETVEGFVRDGSINSSGIKRDKAGIPQEIPQHMLQAAIAARTNRKSSGDNLKDPSTDTSNTPEPYESEMNLKDLREQFMSGQSTFKPQDPDKDKIKAGDVHVKTSDDENTIKSVKKSKGKAPLPPDAQKKMEVKHVLEFKNVNHTDTDMDISTETMNTNLSIDVTDNTHDDDTTVHQVLDLDLIENVPETKILKANQCDDSIILSDRPSNSSTPKSTKKEIPQIDNSEININGKDDLSDSDTEMQDESKSGTTIELNSSHITIHHQDMDNETRKTASLGDLSRLNNISQKMTTTNGTLERAQSLDISDQNEQVLTPKKRKAQNGPQEFYAENLEEHNSKEPKLMTNLVMDAPNSFQQVNRLKKSTEWGNLEDISQISTPPSTPSDADIVVQKTEMVYTSNTPDISKFQFRFSDTPPFVLNQKNNVDDENLQMYGTNVSDDIKVSRHSFNSLERPRSEVFTMVSNFNTDNSQVNQIDEVKYSQPVSLTYIQDTPVFEVNAHSNSPTFTSDVKGVNSINIISKENEKVEHENQNNENIMTIVTTDSQPSSIICIESEPNSLSKINFNEINDTADLLLKTVGVNVETNCVNTETNDVEMASSPKEDPPVNGNHKTYITEIEVITPNKEEVVKKVEKMEQQIINHSPKSVIYEFKSINNSNADLDIFELKSSETDKEEDIKPKFEYAKNAEIKFSTSTYEQPKTEKRLSQIEFLRSNFEKNAELFKSNIPKPTTSPTKTNTSPSKIPVFNSTKATEVSKIPGKQTVSVTSIKSSSRNPSGK